MFASAIALLLVPMSGTAPIEMAQLSIEQRVIIRVPPVRRRARSRSVLPSEPQEWDEHKGPRCLAIRSIGAAALGGRNSIDLILTNGQRYRARFAKRCRSEDFYSGFYVEATDDGSLCAGRDNIQARSGMSCEVDSFRRLVPEK